MVDELKDPSPNVPEPQKMDAPAFIKAVEDAKAEKKPGRVKSAGAKKKSAKATSSTNGGNGQSQGMPSDAKLLEMMKKEAAPAANILGSKPASLNSRLSERFRINPQTTTVGTKREILKLPIRLPNKFEHVRVHPNICVDVMIIKPQDSKETYVVDTCMHDALRRWIVPATLRLALTSDGTHLVWPLRFPTGGDKDYAAWSSARIIAHDAEDEWLSLIWNAGQMAYDKGTTDVDFGEAVWNEFTYGPDAVDLMFAKIKDYFVEDMSHPIVKKLGLQATTVAEEAQRRAYDAQRKAAEATAAAAAAEAIAKAAAKASEKKGQS